MLKIDTSLKMAVCIKNNIYHQNSHKYKFIKQLFIANFIKCNTLIVGSYKFY